MDNNAGDNVKKEKIHIKSIKQAKATLDILLQDLEKRNLERGISGLLNELNNPELNLLIQKYPELLEEYDLKKMLSGNIEILHINKHDLKTAGLFFCLQLLIDLCYELKENENPADKRFESIAYILNSISFTAFVNELLVIIVSIIEKNNSEEFQDLDSDLENDLELKKHYELTLWLSVARIFLESVYTCFEDRD